MHLNYCGSGHTCPAFGLDGGKAGLGAAHRITAQLSGETIAVLDNAGSADVAPHQSWVASTGGGGGYGDPTQRPVSAVVDDVVDGFVSPEAARETYRVCVTWHNGQWHDDEAATRVLRTGG
jgi:N-methylhydantoinase B